MIPRRKPLRQKTKLKTKTPLKSKSTLKARSKKTEELYKKRRPFVEKILRERPLCEACKVFAKHDGKTTFRQHMSRDVHELIRRSQGGSIIDENNVLAVCRVCHIRIGDNPQLAFDLGLAKRGFERNS